MDYPDLPGPEDFETITAREAPAISVPLQAFGPQVRIDDGILHLAVEPGADTRWIGLVTREAFRVPMRIEIEVRPITELRLRFGSHNRHLAFDQHGAVANPTPWFLTVDARRGRAVPVGASPLMAEDEWTLVRFEVDDHEQRLFVNGVLRHTWGEDASGMRTRVGIGLRERSLHVRSFTRRTARIGRALKGRQSSARLCRRPIGQPEPEHLQWLAPFRRICRSSLETPGEQ